MAHPATLDTTLLDVLSNPVVFDHLIPHLPLQAISRLSQVSTSFRQFVFRTPKVFRYLDLSRCRGAFISPELTPLDTGGSSWRAERMDENLTEDEFYAGPLRGILARLNKKRVLQDVQVLVLDGLASVTNDLVAEITTKPEYNIRIISIRKCVNVNQPRLQQYLRFLCRSDRPEGSPKLQGIYFFTDPGTSKQRKELNSRSEGVMETDGATLGVLPADKSRSSRGTNPWYSPSGQVVSHGAIQRTSWEETLLWCRGIIAFDAVLCTHMHEAMAPCLHEASREFLSRNKAGIPTMATLALGPEGCSGCGTAPRGSPVWGESDIFDFPLLWPPPYSGRISDAVQPPALRANNSMLQSHSRPKKQRLIVSCSWCLANRHCDSCHRWWCGDCYNPKRSSKLSDLEDQSTPDLASFLSAPDEILTDRSGDRHGDNMKVLHGLCVENCLVGEMMSGAGSFGMWA